MRRQALKHYHYPEVKPLFAGPSGHIKTVFFLLPFCVKTQSSFKWHAYTVLFTVRDTSSVTHIYANNIPCLGNWQTFRIKKSSTVKRQSHNGCATHDWVYNKSKESINKKRIGKIFLFIHSEDKRNLNSLSLWYANLRSCVHPQMHSSIISLQHYVYDIVYIPYIFLFTHFPT